MRVNICFFFLLNLISASARAIGDSGINHHTITIDQVTLQILHVDPRNNAIRLGVSQNFYKPETPSEIMTRLGGAAAINAGFFNYGGPGFVKSYIYSNVAVHSCYTFAFPDSLLKVNGELLYDSAHTSALGWKEKSTDYRLGELSVVWFIKTKESKEISLISRNADIKQRKIYPRIFSQKNKIVRVLTSKEFAVHVPTWQDEFLFDLDDESALDLFEVANYFEVSYRIVDAENSNWDEMDHIVSGHPILVKNHSIPTIFSTPLSLKGVSRRTGLCILADGTWNLVVSDNLIKLIQFAQIFTKMDCKDAINFDGGPSTTMVVDRATVSCHYKLKKAERPVSDAIVVIPQDESSEL